ncbi:putative membrane protein [Propioniciclava tarda]|nr:putative membrane protein [Propioniciclava tarda]
MLLPTRGILDHMTFLVRTFVTAVSVAVAAFLIQGISVTGNSVTDKLVTLVAVALVIGVLNTLVKPILQALTGCLIMVTFGLFLLVINAGLLLLASVIAQSFGLGFSVAGFLPALFGSIIISIVSGVMNGMLGTNRS